MYYYHIHQYSLVRPIKSHPGTQRCTVYSSSSPLSCTASPPPLIKTYFPSWPFYCPPCLSPQTCMGGLTSLTISNKHLIPAFPTWKTNSRFCMWYNSNLVAGHPLYPPQFRFWCTLCLARTLLTSLFVTFDFLFRCWFYVVVFLQVSQITTASSCNRAWSFPSYLECQHIHLLYSYVKICFGPVTKNNSLIPRPWRPSLRGLGMGLEKQY